MVNVFIIGSKGIPAKYGGFETFVDKLTANRKNKCIKYHISCLSNEDSEFEYNSVRCFNVKVNDIGNAKAVLYDIKALKESIKYIESNNLENCIVYILACRIGPFLRIYKRKLKARNIKLYVNPDGHEWKRSKWNWIIRNYWKISERLMVKHSDLLICDSKGIEEYIRKDYKQYNPNTTFIAYGSDMNDSAITDDSHKILDWYKKNKTSKMQYYLIVGRFVPENNYELIIREFIKSNSKKDLVIISNIEENKFYKDLLNRTNFESDKRIKFVGTVYDQQLLKKIRENAYGYIHGHEVGGTNPSLLEALASTRLNLLLDVNFNKEVGQDSSLYFNKDNNNLSKIINFADQMNYDEIEELKIKARNRIAKNYTWEYIVNQYEKLFLN
ncbi:MAG: beta 1-4 rhamnosyltransferase Cps2T [Paeniclostridium sp.]